MFAGIFLIIASAVAISEATYKHYAYASGPSYVYNQDFSDPHFLRRYLVPFFGKGYQNFIPYYSMGKGGVASSKKQHSTTVVETSGKESAKTHTTSVKEQEHLPFIGASDLHQNYAIYNVRNTLPSKKYVHHMPPPPKPVTIVNVKNKHAPPLPPRQPQQPITILNIKNHHQAPQIPADPQHINIMNIDKDIPAPMAPPQLPTNVRIMNVDESGDEVIPVMGEHVVEEASKAKTTVQQPYEEVYSRTQRSAPEGYNPIPLDLSFTGEQLVSENANGDGWENVAVQVNPTTEMPAEEENDGRYTVVDALPNMSEYESNQVLVNDPMPVVYDDNMAREIAVQEVEQSAEQSVQA